MGSFFRRWVEMTAAGAAKSAPRQPRVAHSSYHPVRAKPSPGEVFAAGSVAAAAHAAATTAACRRRHAGDDDQAEQY